MSITNEHRVRFNPNTDPATEPIPVVAAEKRDTKKAPVSKKFIASLAIGGTLMAGLAGGVAAFGGKDKAPTDTRPVATGEAFPGQEGVEGELPPLDMYNTDITHEDYGRQLDVVLPYLEEHRAQSLQEVADEINFENRVPLSDPNQYPEGSDMYRAVVDQNNITADLWTISGEENTVLARNLLNGVLWNDPDLSNDAYDATEKLIGNGKGRIIGYAEVNETSPIVTKGNLGKTEITGQESYLTLLTSRTEAKSYEQVISKRTSLSGKYSNNVVVESIQWGGPGFNEHPSQIAAEPES